MLADYFSNIEYIQIVISLIDIILVWLLIYFALKLLIGTRGIHLLKGIFFIIILKVAFNFIGLQTMSYIIDQLLTWGVLAVIIIFQPELRRTLEHIGRFDIYHLLFSKKTNEDKIKTNIIDSLIDATRHMARRRIGALIVLENTTGLDDYADNGIQLNAHITSELIINIFIPNTPLHDGALILNKDVIRAASCVLPLSDNRDIATSFGTRHRAALGLAENTDAIILVVSEETGHISIARNGFLQTDLKQDDIRTILNKYWLTNTLGGLANE